MSGWGGSGAPVSRGELGPLGLGAVAIPLLTPSRLGGEGTEAPSLPGLPSSWFGGRGADSGGTVTRSARWVWKEEARQEVGASWAFSRRSTGRVGLRAWQPGRFSFLPSSGALRFVLLLK